MIRKLIRGIPNTGKSTLINNLRRAHVDGNVKRAERKLICATGDSPAVTRVRFPFIIILNFYQYILLYFSEAERWLNRGMLQPGFQM